MPSGTPVVWVQHSGDDLAAGSDGVAVRPRAAQGAAEPLVHKRYGDSFEDTDLEDVLAAAGVGRLVVAGAQTDECIRSTIHGAFTRGYDVTLVGDAHTTEDLTEYGAPPPDAGHRPHQPLLEVPGRARAHRRGHDTAEVSFGA